MQITQVEVIPIDLKLRHAVKMAGLAEIKTIQAIFVRMETRQGQNAWGCAVAHPDLTGETVESLLAACQACAAAAPGLHPTNIEYSLAEITSIAAGSKGAVCAFDLAFHDLLGLASGLPLYRLLGGYRSTIPTSVTIPLGSVEEGIALAQERARSGFRMMKIKGGLDPELDVRRVQTIHRLLPSIGLRLDADGGYSIQDAIDVSRALRDILELLEQPTPPDELESLRQVTADIERQASPIRIIADQSASSPATVLELVAQHLAHGVCVQVARCGGLRCARQVDAIARATQASTTYPDESQRMSTMISCVIEPAMLISAGLSLALSSPNVRYCDLDGHLDLENDPSIPTFTLKDGWLTASEVPGLGCTMDLG